MSSIYLPENFVQKPHIWPRGIQYFSDHLTSLKQRLPVALWTDIGSITSPRWTRFTTISRWYWHYWLADIWWHGGDMVPFKSYSEGNKPPQHRLPCTDHSQIWFDVFDIAFCTWSFCHWKRECNDNNSTFMTKTPLWLLNPSILVLLHLVFCTYIHNGR